MQKKIQVIINVILFVLIGVLSYLSFSKQEKIGFIKSNLVLSKYQGMLDATASYQSKSSVWQANLDTLGKEYQQSVERYQRESKSMSEKERKLSEELLDTKRKQILEYESGIKQKAQQEDQTLTKQVYEKVNQYLKKYGEDHGYKIIFAANETGNIVYGNDAIDLSEDVIEGLNKEYKNK